MLNMVLDDKWAKRLTYKNSKHLEEVFDKRRVEFIRALKKLPRRTTRGRQSFLRAARRIMNQTFEGYILGTSIEPGKTGFSMFMVLNPLDGGFLCVDFITLVHKKPDELLIRPMPVVASPHAMQRYYQRMDTYTEVDMMNEFGPGIIFASRRHADGEFPEFSATRNGALVCIHEDSMKSAAQFPVTVATWLHREQFDAQQQEAWNAQIIKMGELFKEYPDGEPTVGAPA